MNTAHEWLNLVEVSGPFLAVPVLRDVFPQGLDELDTARARRLRSAHEEWREAVDDDDPALEALHAAWVDEVMRSALELNDSTLRSGEALGSAVSTLFAEHDHIVVPEFAIVDPTRADALLMPIHVFPPNVELDATRRFGGLSSSPAERLAMQLRALGLPLGLLTNGERWMLVHAPVGQVATFASWYARLWGQELSTLRAFVALLGVRRFFAPEADRLPALFQRSLEHQDEVTDALGEQVRRAVQVLVQALDRVDVDRSRELLRNVRPSELYEAGLTVMMRLVFLLAAEERGLLLLGEPRYDAFYAVSTLRLQLRLESDELLERRGSAWSRLLAVFRAVYGGIDHPTLRLPALGGSLFDPDRFAFLEGREKGTSWKTDLSAPLPIDDRTVLLLLEAIQIFEGRALSYRALDIEQLGHVYEGLLERTVERVDDVTIELDGTKNANRSSVTLGELESARLDGKKSLVALLKDRTGRSTSVVSKAVGHQLDSRLDARLLASCRGDFELRDRLATIANLIRTDPWEYPLVHPKGTFVVVLGAERRDTGTQYTPKSLTERIVEETLTPVVYVGPSTGAARKDWSLKSSTAILDLKICDPAMGSGAFLVQACRFLSARLVEAWSDDETAGRQVDVGGGIHDFLDGADPMPSDEATRAEIARRLVAERCLYGVDVNPLAVELSKLSLWLVTLAKGRPFGFLDHKLRHGDSLLGIGHIEQLTGLSMDPTLKVQGRLFGQKVSAAVTEALAMRLQLREMPIDDINDVEGMAAIDAAARTKLQSTTCLADAFTGIVLASPGGKPLEFRLAVFASEADRVADGDKVALADLYRRVRRDLASDSSNGPVRRPFHWPIEFPEVFEDGGFDAVVGNPPFLSAISKSTGRTESDNRYYKLAFRSFAHGSYDLSLLFWARTLTDILKPSGRYGFLSPTSMLSASGPWKEWMHTRWRPDSLTMLPIDYFHSARIRTTAIVGGMGQSAVVRVADLTVPKRPENCDVQWTTDLNWYSAISGSGQSLGEASDSVWLSSCVVVRAGCTTGDAYKLKPLIEDSKDHGGRKLITTGSIDRYRIKWGMKDTRYLKDDYRHPRWPANAPERTVARAHDRQSVPKVLVAGYTAIIESWLDLKGEAAGVVQTWVLTLAGNPSNIEDIAALPALSGVLNSATFTREFVRRYGANAMTGKYIVVKKKSLEQMPIPRIFDSPLTIASHLTGPPEAFLPDTWRFSASWGAVSALLSRASVFLATRAENDPIWSISDKLAHYLAAALYGLTMRQADEDYRWWCDRSGSPTCDATMHEALTIADDFFYQPQPRE